MQNHFYTPILNTLVCCNGHKNLYIHMSFKFNPYWIRQKTTAIELRRGFKWNICCNVRIKMNITIGHKRVAKLVL